MGRVGAAGAAAAAHGEGKQGSAQRALWPAWLCARGPNWTSAPASSCVPPASEREACIATCCQGDGGAAEAGECARRARVCGLLAREPSPRSHTPLVAKKTLSRSPKHTPPSLSYSRHLAQLLKEHCLIEGGDLQIATFVKDEGYEATIPSILAALDDAQSSDLLFWASRYNLFVLWSADRQHPWDALPGAGRHVTLEVGKLRDTDGQVVVLLDGRPVTDYTFTNACLKTTSPIEWDTPDGGKALVNLEVQFSAFLWVRRQGGGGRLPGPAVPRRAVAGGGCRQARLLAGRPPPRLRQGQHRGPLRRRVPRGRRLAGRVCRVLRDARAAA